MFQGASAGLLDPNLRILVSEEISEGTNRKESPERESTWTHAQPWVPSAGLPTATKSI